MNNTTNPLLEIYKQQSIYLLNRQLLWNVLVFMIAAPAAACSNLSIVFVLVRCRKIFKSHHYRLLTHMALVSFLLAINSVLSMGVKRLYLALSNTPEVITTLNCSIQFLLHELFLGAEAVNVMIVSLDRLFAVAVPIYYKKFNLFVSYKIATIFIPWSISVVNLILKYALYTKEFADSMVVICILNNTRPKNQNNYTSTVTICVCCMTMLSYFSGIAFVKYKISKDKNNSKTLRKDLGYRLILSCGTDGIINSCTYFVGVIFVAVLVMNAPLATQIITGPVSLGFYFICLTTRFVVMFTLNKEFRKCTTSLISTKNRINAVSSTTAISRSNTKESRLWTFVSRLSYNRTFTL